MKSKCHICIYWTPEKGCEHYGPETGYIKSMPAASLNVKNVRIISQEEFERHNAVDAMGNCFSDADPGL